MKKKVCFFDADRTLIDLRTGVPESARAALQQLVDNGHEAFLCTGRCYASVVPELRNLPLTGIVAGCGACIQYTGKTVLHKVMTAELAKRVLDTARAHDLVPIMEGTDYIYMDADEIDTYLAEKDAKVLHMVQQQAGKAFLPIKGNENNLQVVKCSCVAKKTGGDYEGALKDLEDEFYGIYHYRDGKNISTVEFMPNGYSKGSSVEFVCEKLGVDIEDSVCFGDSLNDLDMFKTAHTRVAMGDSYPQIKELASFVTDTLEEDGIQHGLQHLGLIS
jgi:Cof subfamily protein (haloacid dehalogenase superfamily)